MGSAKILIKFETVPIISELIEIGPNNAQLWSRDFGLEYLF